MWKVSRPGQKPDFPLLEIKRLFVLPVPSRVGSDGYILNLHCYKHSIVMAHDLGNMTLSVYIFKK